MQVDFGLISIIMAAYNAEKTIEQAINSVLNQTYPNFELLVVNDCSTDKTAALVEAVAKKDNRVRLISNKKNSGVSYTRKHGLEETRGEWIAILDSDDAWKPEKLEKQIALQEKTNADLLFTYAKPRIGEVLHDGEPVFASKFDGTFQKPSRRLRSGRIVRIVQDQHLHAIPGIRRNRIQVRQEPAFRQ